MSELVERRLGSGFQKLQRAFRMVSLVAGFVVFSLIFAEPAWSASIALQPVGGSPTYRWMDIADNTYLSAYQSSFGYGDPTVTLAYNDVSNTFSGTLTATGLKPNFAYQMKLQGKPGIADWANEQLGYAGRWWYTFDDGSTQSQGNADDTFYAAHKNDPDYTFQGYLLFDFFATDEQGSASVSFAADSSYHVLWATPGSTTADNTGHRAPVNPGNVDSAVRSYTFDPDNNTSGAYSDSGPDDYVTATVGIYAEWENGRAYPGQLEFLAGSYNCQFILTEESFHQSGLGGSWASAMSGDVNFTVVPLPSSGLLLFAGLVAVVGVKRRRKKAQRQLGPH
jgi:hypothetical protein